MTVSTTKTPLAAHATAAQHATPAGVPSGVGTPPPRRSADLLGGGGRPVALDDALARLDVTGRRADPASLEVQVVLEGGGTLRPDWWSLARVREAMALRGVEEAHAEAAATGHGLVVRGQQATIYLATHWTAWPLERRPDDVWPRR